MFLPSYAISWINGFDHEDGEDVELVRWKMVVEKVPRIPVGQPELVPATVLHSPQTHLNNHSIGHHKVRMLGKMLPSKLITFFSMSGL